MGLFDFGQEGGLLGGFQQKLTSDPAAQRALLQFGLQMLAGRGRNTAENIGQAGLGAAQAYDQQSQMARQQQMQDWQIGQAKTEAQRKQAEWERQQKRDNLPAQFMKPTMPPMDANDPNAQPSQPQFDMQGYKGALMGIDPRAALELDALTKKAAPALMNVAPGGAIFDPTKGSAVYQAPFKPPEPEKTPEALRSLEIIYGKGSPQYMQAAEQYAKKLTTHTPAPSMSVSYGAPMAALDAQGNPVFARPAKDGLGMEVVPGGVRPPKTGAEEATAKDTRERSRQSQQMSAAMDDAERILKAEKPTASGVGTVLDAAGRVVGVSTQGAQSAAKLQALSGWLVANVPRMEGPQSNFDVQNYMTMAGKIGDPGIPIKERQAALATVRGLMNKYAAINGAPTASQPATGAYSDAEKERRYQEWKRQQGAR